MNGMAIEQSIVVFQSSVGRKFMNDESDEEDEAGDLRIVNGEIDKTVTLYICATMWHETRNEMTQMIKSILK